MPAGLLMLTLIPIVGRLLNKLDLRLMIGVGIVITGCAIWWMTNFYLGVSFKVLALARVAQFFGLALLFLPVNALGFRDVPEGQMNYASALINLSRNFGGSIGVAFASTLIVRHSQFHQSRLVEHLQSLNPAYSDYTTQLGHAAHVAPGSLAVTAGIFQSALQQATLLSYLDAFKALAVIFLCLLPLLLFVKPGAADKPGGEVG